LHDLAHLLTKAGNGGNIPPMTASVSDANIMPGVSKASSEPGRVCRNHACKDGRRPFTPAQIIRNNIRAKCAGRNSELALLRVRQPSLAQALAAGWRIDFPTRLCRLLYRRKSGAFTGWAFDFRGYSFTLFQNLLLWNEENHLHVVMQHGLPVTIVPLEGHARPVLFRDDALIVLVLAPANASAYFESSGLIAGHCSALQLQ
jgi:hypothetical protein